MMKQILGYVLFWRNGLNVTQSKKLGNSNVSMTKWGTLSSLNVVKHQVFLKGCLSDETKTSQVIGYFSLWKMMTSNEN